MGGKMKSNGKKIKKLDMEKYLKILKKIWRLK